jgi:hypothetical protein
MNPDPITPSGYLDERDAAYIETVEDASLRETMLCTVTTYRRPDRLEAGDLAPDLGFLRLTDGAAFRLSCPSNRPVVLLFGSYT